MTLKSGDVPFVAQLFNTARRQGRFDVESAGQCTFIRTILGSQSGSCGAGPIKHQTIL
ncbi:hypothetical protein HT746_00515 [Burkholderia pyrrocinia]|uniref:hypothetical protein n=1 Tax=Burkholderia pyrrocinia TaxID=60550 RepID=UPI0015767807|nr:hypothetical protein [Burkholderia pyrrocinia]NTX25647.1 hypothetical protein [Burkholderia pyrrocinia]